MTTPVFIYVVRPSTNWLQRRLHHMTIPCWAMVVNQMLDPHCRHWMHPIYLHALIVARNRMASHRHQHYSQRPVVIHSAWIQATTVVMAPMDDQLMNACLPAVIHRCRNHWPTQHQLMKMNTVHVSLHRPTNETVQRLAHWSGHKWHHWTRDCVIPHQIHHRMVKQMDRPMTVCLAMIRVIRPCKICDWDQMRRMTWNYRVLGMYRYGRYSRKNFVRECTTHLLCLFLFINSTRNAIPAANETPVTSPRHSIHHSDSMNGRSPHDSSRVSAANDLNKQNSPARQYYSDPRTMSKIVFLLRDYNEELKITPNLL